MREEMENEKLDSFQDFLFFFVWGGGDGILIDFDRYRGVKNVRFHS